MKNITIQPNVILSLALFSAGFFFGSYYLLSKIDLFIYQIIIGLILLILYINFLKLFVFELCSLKKTRITEMFNYFLMYLVTIGAFVLPNIIEPQYMYEFPIIRVVIISFATLLLFKYFVYMILGPIHDIVYRLKYKIFFEDKKYNPLVTVMIPAWNEEVGIIRTIESVLQSKYRNIEIVIINDGSIDNSNLIINKFVRKYNKNEKNNIEINYLYQENTGKGGALNRAIEMAKGDILVSIDGDCVVSPEAIGAFVETFKNPKVMASVGNVKVANRDSSIGIVQYLEFLFSFYFKRTESLLGAIYIIGGAAGAFRKEVFKKIGGYSTNNITEDIELTVRMQNSGMKIEYSPDAIVYTEGASDLESLKKQRLRWKRGRFETFFQYIHMFFSLKNNHNKALTCFVMPLAIIQEIQLLLEIPFIIFLYTFSIINSDYTSFITGVIVVGTMFIVQFIFYDKSTRNIYFILLAPIGWLLFYIATYVEASALINAIISFVTKKKVAWQKWERKGIVTSSIR